MLQQQLQKCIRWQQWSGTLRKFKMKHHAGFKIEQKNYENMPQQMQLCSQYSLRSQN